MDNLFNQIAKINDPGQRGIAKVTGQRGGGVVVAETPTGARLLLSGSAETGTHVYYTVRNSTIIGEAPAVTWTAYGV